MTQSSPHGGMKTFALEQVDPNADLGPVLCRDFIANNILHAADQSCARVLVNEVAADDSFIVDNVDQYSTGIADDVSWRPVTAYGPFPVSTRAVDGSYAGYRIRAALFAAASAGAPKSVEYAVQMLRYDPSIERVRVREVISGINAVVFSATSSTTPGWLTPTTEDVCTVSAEAVGGRILPQPLVPGVSTPVSVIVGQMLVRVLARGTAEARLYGVHIAEVY